MNGEGFKFPSASLIKLSKKLHIVQTVCVDIGAQGVDRQVQAVSDEEYQDKYNGSCNIAPYHAAHLVKYGGDNAGSKSQCQQTGVGKDITQEDIKAKYENGISLR